MIIREINIVEFGGVKNRKIVFSNGLNLIYGENEAGKSSVCAFIRFMLYGLSSASERERHLNLDSKQCAGSLILETHSGEVFTIQRSQGNSTKSNLSVRQFDGKEYDDWKTAQTPGEYFSGINEDLYLRSIYVSQETRSKLDSSTSDAITNLLVSGNENINVKNAKKALDGLRLTLLHKNAGGGEIYQLEQGIKKLQDEFLQGSLNKNKIECYTNQIVDAKKRLVQVKSERDKLKSDVANAKNARINKLLDSKSELKIKENSYIYSKNMVRDQFTTDGFLPDNDYIVGLKEVYNEYIINKQVYEQFEKEHRDLEQTVSNKVKNNCAVIDKYGGIPKIQKLQSINENSDKKIKNVRITSVCLSILMILVIPILISFDLILLTAFPLSIIIGSVLFAIFCVKSVRKSQNNFKQIMSEFIFEDTLDIKQIFNDYQEYQTMKFISSDTRPLSEQKMTEKRKIMEDSEKKYTTMLAKWGRESYDKTLSDYNNYHARLNEIDEDNKTTLNQLDKIESLLSNFQDSEIQTAINSMVRDEKLASQTEYHYAQKLEETENYINRLESELKNIELTMATEKGSQTDLTQIAKQIEKSKELLESKKFIFNAVTLTQQKLTTSEQSIKKLVTPYLCEKSSEIFDFITEGRYKRLLINDSFILKYSEGTDSALTDSQYFSIGSADLAWLSLRFALHAKLSEEKKLPIILDECMVYFDDARLRKTLEYLKNSTKKGAQVILFSASRRELEMLGSGNNIVNI